VKAILFTPKEYEDESVSLAETAGYEVIKVYYIKGETNPKYFVGQDKVEELKNSDVLRDRRPFGANKGA